MPKKNQLTEEEADFVNSAASGIGYALDAKNAVKNIKAAKRALDAKRMASRLSNLPRVALKTTKAAAKRAPLAGTAIDMALLSHPDTRASVFREVEDDAANAGPVKRMVKGYLSPITTASGMVNMANETNDMMNKEIIEATEPSSSYIAKKKKAMTKKKAMMDDVSFADAVERRLNRQA
jgi:hypothetical protein